jgi:hypothetical protein
MTCRANGLNLTIQPVSNKFPEGEFHLVEK